MVEEMTEDFKGLGWKMFQNLVVDIIRTGCGVFCLMKGFCKFIYCNGAIVISYVSRAEFNGLSFCLSFVVLEFFCIML